MTKEERIAETNHLKYSANTPKEELMRICFRLEEIGRKKEARRLDKIIERLEIWQNT